jgi:(2Fe-2S) ferredoxin
MDLDEATSEAARRGIGSIERHIFLCIGPDCCTPEQGDASWQRLRSAPPSSTATPTAAPLPHEGRLPAHLPPGPHRRRLPEGTWYARMTPDNVDRVVDSHLAGGVPVEELVIGTNPLPPPLPTHES